MLVDVIDQFVEHATSKLNTSVMIACLPTTTYWCKQDLPHMTLVYAGEIPKLTLSLRNTLAKAALDLSQTYPKFTLKVLRKDQLGDQAEVEVLLLKSTPDLLAMRKFVERWNASQYTEFNPHATIGPVGSSGELLPITLTFDRIMMGWGDSRLIYDLL